MPHQTIYAVAYRARAKLSLEVSSNRELDLRRVLGHVNLLDCLVAELVNIGCEGSTNALIRGTEEKFMPDDDPDDSKGSNTSDTPEAPDDSADVDYAKASGLDSDEYCTQHFETYTYVNANEDDLTVGSKDMSVVRLATDSDKSEMSDSDSHGYFMQNFGLCAYAYTHDDRLATEMNAMSTDRIGISQELSNTAVRVTSREVDFSPYHLYVYSPDHAKDALSAGLEETKGGEHRLYFILSLSLKLRESG